MALRAHANPVESTVFWRDAIAWRGSITAKILLRIGLFTAYSGLIAYASETFGWEGVDPVHLGYTGGLLAVLLVLRTNASYDRWWEARKLWGGIVNQSRNLAVKAMAYGPDDDWKTSFVRWTACFCHATRMSLRGQRDTEALVRVLGSTSKAQRVIDARHMPTCVATEVAHLLATVRASGTMDGFVFMEVDRERAALIDHVGACERILRTPTPRVHSIKLRRFILMYLLAVPLALASSSLVITVIATALISYPLLAIDQIAYELENPFSTLRESHLPLDLICDTIEKDLAALRPEMLQPDP